MEVSMQWCLCLRKPDVIGRSPHKKHMGEAHIFFFFFDTFFFAETSAHIEFKLFFWLSLRYLCRAERKRKLALRRRNQLGISSATYACQFWHNRCNHPLGRRDALIDFTGYILQQRIICPVTSLKCAGRTGFIIGIVAHETLAGKCWN